MKKYLNAENITVFVIVVLAVIAAPVVAGWFDRAKMAVTK